MKQAVLISKLVEVRHSIAFASPSSVLRALQVYCSSYYGSLAGWELEGAEAQKFYGVWRLNVLLTHKLPRATHRYFLPMLSPGAVSARAEILSRFIKFFRSLRAAPSHEVVSAALLLARDKRSTLAKNIDYVEKVTGQDAWVASPQLVCSIVVERETVAPNEEDEWRLPYLAKLLEQRVQLHTLGMSEEEERVQELINSLCIS